MLKKLLTYIMVLGASLMLAGCSSSVNDKIKDAYGLSDIPSSEVDMGEAESMAGDSEVMNQQAIAESNADSIYEAYEEGNLNKFNDGISDVINTVGSGKDMSIAERALISYYSVYGLIRGWAPIIAIVSFIVGGLVFALSRYNKGARRFALFGLMIGVPIFMAVIVFGLGILNDVFFY